MRTFLMFLLVLLASRGNAAAEEKAAGGKTVPLNRCFCGRLADFPVMYYIDRIKSAPPECAALTFDKETQHFWEHDIAECGDLEKCDKGLEKYAEKRKILDAKTAEAEKRMKACCALPKEELRAETPCSNKCGGDWAGILKVLAAEAEKLDKAQAAERAKCLAKSRKTGKEKEPAGGKGKQ